MYSFLYSIFLPILLIRFLMRSIGDSNHLKGMSQRFGNVAVPISDNIIWIHAVSVGETIATKDLVEHLLNQGYRIFLTNMTLTGSQTTKRIFAQPIKNQQLVQSFVPFDLAIFINRVIKRLKPKALIIMETEIWPNMIDCCYQQSIPTIVANARLSERSFKGYQRFQWLIKRTLKKVTLFATQYNHDSKNFRALGVDKKAVFQTGSIKFDVNVDSTILQQAIKNRDVWNLGNRLIICCASTHDQEESQLLTIFGKLINQRDNLLLLLVPRHPQRFESVIKLSQSKYVTQQLSQGGTISNNTQVLVGDTMGELPMLLALSDIVFMGGTLVPVGGHNFIEPAVVAKPTICGPHVFNFKEVAMRLQQNNGLIVSHSKEILEQQLLELVNFSNKRMGIGTNAKKVVEDNKGATIKLLQAIESVISQSSANS